MIKTNLPVLILKNVIIFPSSEMRLEFDDLEEKEILSLAESCYDNHVLVITPKDQFEIEPDISEFPKIGIIAKINMKMEMPNGKTRIILRGRGRAKVHDYTKQEKTFISSITRVDIPPIEIKEELAYHRLLVNKLEDYVSKVPYVSDAVLSQIGGITSINKITDIICLYLQLDFDRQLEYINESNPSIRVKMLVEDMDKDLEVLEIEKNIDAKLNKNLDETQKEFILREKIKIIKEELGETIDKDLEIKDLKEKALKLNCSDKIKDRLLNEINKLSLSSPMSPELSLIRNYIDWLLELPWNIYTKDNYDFNKVKKALDSSHYGLDTIKERILEYIAVEANNPDAKSPVICLVGPPGVGKTSLAMSVAKALNKNCTKISVGGINDEAEIVGHRRTYVGALPGKIIQGMKKAGSSNPVFIIDEIDKMTKDIKGDPASALLEVLDPEQNIHFQDHYIEEEYDLSKVMFVLTANYINQIPFELQDRLEIIEISSYTEYEKIDICKNHLIPRELKQNNLTKNDIIIQTDTLEVIIRNYTKEAGVRELSRLINSLFRKIIKDRIITNTKKKYIITPNNIEKYLGNKKYIDINNDKQYIGYVTGLAYTTVGGEILPIEATLYKGTGNLILTGSLGDVMKESATIALSYIKANSKEFEINYKLLEENDIHIHIPEGAVPKDGPSAGVTLVTCLISLLTNTKIDNKISMTGEITLRGEVLPVGGIKEKIIGAHRNGINKIFLPIQNKKDLEEVPEQIKKDIEFIFIEEYKEIYTKIFKNTLISLF